MSEPIALLAAQTKPCPVCGGSGIVPLLPGLRTHEHPKDDGACLSVECPGYFVLRGAEAEAVLREWLPKNGYKWKITGLPLGEVVEIWSDERGPDGATCWNGDTLAAALCEARGLEASDA